jgi:hypothetical protein
MCTTERHDFFEIRVCGSGWMVEERVAPGKADHAGHTKLRFHYAQRAIALEVLDVNQSHRGHGDTSLHGCITNLPSISDAGRLDDEVVYSRRFGLCHHPQESGQIGAPNAASRQCLHLAQMTETRGVDVNLADIVHDKHNLSFRPLTFHQLPKKGGFAASQRAKYYKHLHQIRSCVFEIELV